MTRLEENNILIEKMVEKVNQDPSGTFEKLVIMHLGLISTTLADISKSLAIIADGGRKEDKNEH